MSKGWDSNMLKKLKTLVGKGLSASEIGKKLEVSKNAVIGKLNRLGWNAKAVEATEKKSTKVKKDTKETKTVAKKPAKKSVLKTLFNKKADKKAVAKKEPVKKSADKAVKKNADTKKTDKKAVAEKPVIKTASKKTKKDLALHELLIQHALQMASLKPNQCRWPIGDPDSDNFHFCGETVFAGKPYCYEHCRQAYQFTTPPKKK
jgi:GcrA cell cycle regulator